MFNYYTSVPNLGLPEVKFHSLGGKFLFKYCLYYYEIRTDKKTRRNVGQKRETEPKPYQNKQHSER